MSELNYPNYLVQGEERLLSQFKDKEKVKALLLSALKPLQDTQDSLIDYSLNNNLVEGTGSILDVIGRIVGEKRLGRLDESYRIALYNRIVINVSEGTLNQLLEILVLLSGGTEHQAFEHKPLTTAFYTNGKASNALARTLTSSSPITSDTVTIYHDPNNDAFIPAEPEDELGILIDDQNREIVNEDSINIAVTYLSALNAENSERAILHEAGDSIIGARVFCEAYR